MTGTSRRSFLLASLALAAPEVRAAEFDDEVRAIVSRIRPPQFPARDFPVTRFGAKADGKTDSTGAIRDAIEACAKAGGGRVVVEGGAFLTGAIHLKSHVNLYVARGAALRFLPDPKLYPAVVTRWEGTECINYSPFIYAYEQENIGITGEGTLDGQAGCNAWWPWAGKGRCKLDPGAPTQRKDRDALVDMAARRVAVVDRRFGEGHYLRPQFVQPYKCRNVVIDGLTVKNSPMWELHPVLCTNVTVRNVKISSHGPNNDGCDPESCKDVLIEGCEFDTGDDCIAIKSGRNEEGRRVPVPSENIVIRKCVMKAGHGGVTLGSEISAGVRNVYVDDCVMSSPDLNQGLRFKNNAMRGGVLEHFRARDIEIGQVGTAIEVDFLYEEGAKGPFKPVVRDVVVVGLRCRQAMSPWTLRGLPNAPIQGITLEDCTFEHADRNPVTEHVEGLTLKSVTVNGTQLG